MASLHLLSEQVPEDVELDEPSEPDEIQASSDEAESSRPPSHELTRLKDEAEVASLSSRDSDDTTFQDLVDLDIDATVVVSSIQTLHSILKSAIGSLISLRDDEDDLEDEITRGVLQECRDLFDNVDELQRAATAYKAPPEQGIWPQAGQDEMDPLPVAVDPMIYKWTSDCVLMALALQADVERLLKQYQSIGADVSDASSWADTLVSAGSEDAAEEIVTLHQYLEPLRHFTTQIAEYMPIIKVDVDEHETWKMTFPPAIPESSAAFTARERGLPSTPRYSDPHVDLRRNLYDLKDELKECLDTLEEDLETCRVLPGVEPMLLEIKESGTAAWTALTEMLSNNGSEWIESGLAGKMSWDEFRGLSASKPRWTRYKVDFRELQSALRLEGARARAVDPRGPTGEKANVLAILADDVQPALDDLQELENLLKVRRRWTVRDDEQDTIAERDGWQKI